MFCPECGNDAGDAKFCPECGNDLSAVRQAQRGRRPDGRSAAPSSPREQRPRAARRAAERREQAPRAGRREQAPARRGGITPVWIWLGFAAVAVVAVILIFALSDRSGGSTTASGSAAPVTADTSGSYSQLVSRGNDLYDQGIAAFNSDNTAQGVEYFRAAAQVYEAAWGKKAGDPNVGTDWAVSLFYSRHHEEALERIDAVLKESPEFQPGHLNKGIFLRTEADEAEQRGESDAARDFLAQAKKTLQKAVDIDAASDTGKRAAELLKDM